jgi:ABC-type phosphate/phosphonate transport system substrate-binding protein
MRRIVSLSLAAVILRLSLCWGAQAQQVRPPLVINVGVSEYQDIEETYTKYVKLFQELAARADSGRSVSFQVAVGTYGEVLDWYASQQIDLAVLAAMPAAELLESGGAEEQTDVRESYVGTLGEHVKPPAEHTRNIGEIFPADPEVEKNRKEYNADFYYRTALVVPKDSPLQKVKDLKDPRYQGQIKYVFVRPYSVSGFILPNSFLKSLGIQPDLEGRAFSNQHSLSLQRLLHPWPEDDKKLLVAFVSDRTQYASDSQASDFRRLDAPMLDQARIPNNAVLVNKNLEDARSNEVKRIVTALFRRRKEASETRDSDFRIQFKKPEDWVRDFDKVSTWMSDADLPRTLLYKSTLDQIIADLEEYERSQGQEAAAGTCAIWWRRQVRLPGRSDCRNREEVQRRTEKSARP